MNTAPYEGFFKNLGNRTRFRIIKSLQNNSKSVTEIAKDIDMEKSAVSHHLKKLKECNLIKSKTQGRKRIYSLSKTVKPALKAAEKHSRKYCQGKCPYKEKTIRKVKNKVKE